jgi:hypothetical protein
MTPLQGALWIERMCALTGISRASYYRHWRRWRRGLNRRNCGMGCSASRQNVEG